MREAEDADRVWRATMALHVRAADEHQVLVAARRLHAVWQEREFAHHRVRDLESALASGMRRGRLTRLRATASFLAWHARRRLQAPSASS